jgi:hypothetical protein
VSNPITPKKIRQRKIAQAVVAGKSNVQIAQEIGMDAKYPSQAVCNRVRDKGVQAEIAELVSESNILSVLTTESILAEIHSLAYNRVLKPKEREGYLRMLAEYKALLKQVNLNETVTSSDALVEQAEQALSVLKAQVVHDVVHVEGAEVDGQGEKVATPSGKEVEATPVTVREKE